MIGGYFFVESGARPRSAHHPNERVDSFETLIGPSPSPASGAPGAAADMTSVSLALEACRSASELRLEMSRQIDRK